ncbi:MAG: hypothetical protein WBW31_08815 [Candidatus Sulfotelmatobacter sp.]
MRRSVGPAIIWFVINDAVTWIGESFFTVQGRVLCLKVFDFLHAGAQQIAADDGAISTSANQRQFLGELLRDCGFFAHLVFRAVRDVDSPFNRLSNRSPGCKKSNVLKASQTPPRSGRRVLTGRLPLEALGPQAEEASSFSQALWVEVGCRHAQIIVSGKVPHDYGENPDAAL